MNDFISKNKTLSLILGLIGTLIIGGLGSGVWEYILKPLFSHSINFILDLSTLGMDTFKNSIYEEISQGFSEKNSIKNYTLIIGFLIGFYLISILSVFRKLRNLKKENEPIYIDFNSDKDKELTKISLRIKIFLFFVICFSITLLVNTKRLDYINESILYYNKLKTIITPYITDKELKLLDSRYAQIKNKEDYQTIINELLKVSESNNIIIKKRDIW